MDNVTLEAPEIGNQGVTLVPPGAAAVPRGETAKERARRYSIAMGDQSIGEDNIARTIETGGEPNLRYTQAQVDNSRQRTQQRDELVSRAVSGQFDINTAYQAYQAYAQPVANDPDTVMEEGFGRNYMRMIYGANATIARMREAAMAEDPQATMAAMNGSEQLMARHAAAIKNLEDAETESGNWISPYGPVKLINKIGQMFPSVSAANIAGPQGSWRNIGLPGEYLIEARRKYYQFPTLGEAQQWLREETKRIAAFNPEDAVDFARAMVDYNMEHAFVNNMIGVADVTPFGTIASAVKLGASAKFAQVLADTIKGSKASTRAEDVFVAVGDVDHAADVLLAKTNFNKADPLGQADAIRMLPWSKNPDMIIEKNPGTMAAERARRLSDILKTMWSKALEGLTTSSRVQRVPREAHEAMLSEAKERIHAEFPSATDYVFNNRLRYEPLNNAYYAEAMIGERDGTALKSISRVENVAQNELGLVPGQYKIVNFFGDQPGDVIPINSAGMAQTRALDPGNRIPGFKSITGQVRLADGTEIKISNRKDGIYRMDTKEKVDPSTVTHYKTAAKDAEWTKVPSVNKRKVMSILAKDKINKDGLGYYISITRAADETVPGVREALLTTKNTDPVSLANYWFGSLLRSAEDQLAYFQRGNRHIATHAPNAMLERISEMAKPIGKLSSDSFEAVNAVLIRNRDFQETIDGELVRGRAFKSQAKFEQEFLDVNRRTPTEQESLAYWTYHQIMDLDWTIRNLGVHRDLARVGVSERYSIGIGEEGARVQHPGKFLPKMPWDSKSDPGIVIIADGKPVEFMYASRTSADRRKEIDTMLTEGYRAIQVANPIDRPYRENLGSGATVNIVIAKDVTSEPLPMNLVDRNPGVHVIYPQEWLVKQPVVTETGEKGRKNYYGDNTILAADTEKEATRLGNAITELQKMFRDDPDKFNRLSIENYIHKNLPRDYDFWHEKFYGREGVEAYLSLDHPIRPVYSGKQVLDLHSDLAKLPQYQNLHNERTSEFNLMRAIDMDFMADRNAPLMQVTNRGTMEKPLWELEKARVLDPMASIERATANSVRQLYLNDIKASSIEQWAAQFGHLLRNPELARDNPFQAFYHGEFRTDAFNPQELAAAKNVKARILNFIGTQTELGRDIHWFNQMTMNMLEKMENTSVLGQPLASKGATRYYNDHELRFVKDPIAFMRSLLFQAKFGLPINFKQFFVQAQGFTNVLGIMTGAHGLVQGPKMTAQAMAAYAFQRGVDLTNQVNILNHIANKAAAWGWDKKQFIEASKWMKDDGWKIVGNEHAYKDAFDPQLFTYKGKQVLSAYPFYEGERLTRMVSGYAAYLEWRKANPTAKFDDFAKAAVLTRADDLSTNMTRASHSALQEGAFRLPSQFYTFSHRILEQYWGKRLTNLEKGGMFAAQSIMYGMPSALGAASFVPIYDWLRGQMLANPEKLPVDINNKWFQAATEGIIQYGLWMATGNKYDIQGRYGPGPSDQFVQFLEGDRNPLDVAMGATGTFIKDMAGATIGPAYRALYTAIRGGDEQYTVTWADIKPLLSQFAVFNDYGNAWVMYNTGKYLSRNGRLVAEGLSTADVAMLVAGAQRREVKDANLILGTLRDQTRIQNQAMTNAMREMRLAFQFMRDNDLKKADVHLANANVYMVVFGDLQEDQMREVRRRVSRELGTLIEEANAQLLKRGFKTQIPPRLRRILGEP